MIDQKLVSRRVLNRARDALPMLPTKNESAQYEQIQGALQKAQPFFAFTGRHLT